MTYRQASYFSGARVLVRKLLCWFRIPLLDVNMKVNCLRYVACSLFLGGVLLATPLPQTADTQNSSADNTKTNKRDRKSSEPTADNGKNNTSDRELMRQIRRDVVSDKSLSTYAHNVKIIA